MGEFSGGGNLTRRDFDHSDIGTFLKLKTTFCIY